MGLWGALLAALVLLAARVHCWEPLQPVPPAQPGPRCFHTANVLAVPPHAIITPSVFHNESNSIYLFIFGGLTGLSSQLSNLIWTQDSTYSSEAWLFDTRLYTWGNATPSAIATPAATSHTPAITQTAWPSPRAGHVSCALVVNNTNVVVVFGGRNTQYSRLNDTWIISLSSQSLVISAALVPAVEGVPSPSPRWGHGAVVYGGEVYMYGGASIDNDNRVWVFSLSSTTTGTWSPLAIAAGSTPPNRLCFSMSLSNIAPWGVGIVVSSGWNTSHSGPPLSDTWVLQPGTPWTWTLQAAANAPRLAAGAASSFYLDDTKISSISAWGIAFDENSSLSPAAYPVGVTDVTVLTTTGTWALSLDLDAQCVSRLPSANVGSSLSVVDNIMFIYGGFDTLVGTISQSFYRALLFSSAGQYEVDWDEVSIPVSPLERMSAASVSYGDRFFIFGGWLRRFSSTSDVWSLSFTSQTWTQLRTFGSRLPALAAASATVVNGNQIYIFGGVYQFRNGTPTFYNNLYSFDPVLNTFTQLVDGFGGQSPPPREMHVAASYNGILYVHGGFTCGQALSDCSFVDSYAQRTYFDDFWAFNSSSGTWAQLQPSGSPPTKRAQHAAVVLWSRSGIVPMLFVYGGVNVQGVLSDMYAYYLNSNSWILLTPMAAPGPRSQHFILGMGDSQKPVKALLVSGVTFASSVSTSLMYYQDVWEFDPTSFKWQNITPPVSSLPPTNTLQESVGIYNDPIDPTGAPIIFTFGGRANNTRLSSALFSNIPGCPLGYFSPSFTTQLCTQCPLGSYSDTIGSECTVCPPSVTTVMEGATSLSQCSVCEAGACQYGSCSVSSVDHTFQCSCDMLVSGPRCDDDMHRNLVIVFCTVVPALLVMLFFGLRWYRRWRNMRILNESNPFQIDPNTIVLERQLGKGTFGTVFKAEFEESTVAVKLMPGNDISGFVSELRQLRALHHPNILHCHGGGMWPDGQLFFVMELCSRGDLSSVLLNQGVAVDWTRARRFALQTADGMMFLHRRNRIHRDLKAMNVFVSENFSVKIGDFGTVKKIAAVPQASSAASDEVGVGTIEWLPPEALDDARAFSKAGDVYSFGIVMWEIASRAQPYAEEDRGPFGRSLKNRIKKGLRPDVTAIRPELYNGTYVGLMQQCWSERQEQRPPFAGICDILMPLSEASDITMATGLLTD